MISPVVFTGPTGYLSRRHNLKNCAPSEGSSLVTETFALLCVVITPGHFTFRQYKNHSALLDVLHACTRSLACEAIFLCALLNTLDTIY